MANTASRDANRCVPAARGALGWREWRDVRAVAALAKSTGATFASVHGVQLRYAAPVPPPACGSAHSCTVQGGAATTTSSQPHEGAPTNARQRRSAQRLSEYQEKRRKEQAVPNVRSRITRLLGVALRNLRRARVEKVHAEWQRLEAAAAAAAEATAEAGRLALVRAEQVRAYLRMLFWRAWTKPVYKSPINMGFTSASSVPYFLGGRFTSARDTYIFNRAWQFCEASGVGRKMVARGSKRHRTPPASSFPSPSSASRGGAPLALMPPAVSVSPVSPSALATRSKKPRSLDFS